MPTMVDAVEVVRQMESELDVKRKEVAKALRTERLNRNLTLEHIAKRVRLTRASVHNIEKGKSWKTKTVLRVARFFDKAAA
jgi:DNA-binding XRE family transcriptional regulator